MSRRKAREMALQVLFQLDYNQTERDAAIGLVFSEREKTSETAKLYAHELIRGTLDHIQEIDTIISGSSSEWKIERMAGVDRNIARIAVYEMQFGAERLSANIIINEAVELAKLFGTEDSGRFINGILGSLVKNRTNKNGLHSGN